MSSKNVMMVGLWVSFFSYYSTFCKWFILETTQYDLTNEMCTNLLTHFGGQ